MGRPKLTQPENPDAPPKSVVHTHSDTVAAEHSVISFRNRPMVLVDNPFPRYIPLTKERFDKLAYPILGGQTRSRMADVYTFLSNTAEDHSAYDHLVAFGDPTIRDDGTAVTPMVWNTRTVSWETTGYQNTVWRSPYSPLQADDPLPIADKDGNAPASPRLPFIMELANNNPDLYDDIMQAMAPLIMDKKPDGVIWFVGDGANGKSTLMDALYQIFPGLLSSITVKRLEDGRDTPSLNGVLGNVVKESSEGRVDDTETYKAVGTHEDFQVHKFHSQESITINGNVHHIFSANNVPMFNDKGYSARRRTFIIPFDARFESDPTFEERTFTPEFFGKFIKEMGRYAQQIKRQGYKYKFSSATTRAKAEYDEDANNAEAFANWLLDEEGIVAFDSFNSVRIQYQSWCLDNGMVELGVTNLRRAMKAVGFERGSFKSTTGHVSKRYLAPGVGNQSLETAGPQFAGLFRLAGWQPELAPDAIEATVDGEPAAPEPPQQQVLGEQGEW